MSNQLSPKDMGFRLPAEWEPHEATMVSWPRPDGISFPGSYEKVIPTYLTMLRYLAQSERVYLNVLDAETEKEVRARFKGDVPSTLTFFHVPTQEPWARDHGPIVLKDAHGKRLLTDWEYNAWGGKYAPWDLDNAVPQKISRITGIPFISTGMVLEGGSIEPNGAGTILTSKACLLNENRNPTLTQNQIEENLKRYLGVSQVVWLGDGIEGDDTDGHIDDLSRFVSHNEVVTVVEHNSDDPNFEPLRENLETLKATKLLDGTPLKVYELPMPARRDREDIRLPMSYANFYISNKYLLMPSYNDPQDVSAENILRRLYPTRTVVPIDCSELIWGLGAFHCLTQQIPA